MEVSHYINICSCMIVTNILTIISATYDYFINLNMFYLYLIGFYIIDGICALSPLYSVYFNVIKGILLSVFISLLSLY